jgi:hypothetical protein
VTKEAVFFDRTGLVLERAKTVGELLGLQKEKRLLGVVIGAVNPYREKRYGDTAPVNLKTFYSTGDNGRWINHFDGNPLNDYTNIDIADQQFANTVDPNTGEPIILGKRFVLAPAQMRRRIEQIATATDLWKLTNTQTMWTGSTNFPAVGTIGRNLVSDIGYATSSQLYAQLKAQLGLDNTKVTDAGLAHLKGLTHLQVLVLDSTEVTDAGLEHLEGMTELRTLHLFNTKVTDAGLAHLKGLNQLQDLLLDRRKVTDAGVMTLQQELPKCHIFR